MSPWNIISRFRSKATPQAAKPTQEPAIPPSEKASLAIASEGVPAKQTALAYQMEPDHERVVVRVTAHQVSSENSAVTEQLADTEVATKAEEPGNAHQVSNSALPISNARPIYDLGAKRKAAKTSRVDLKSARAKTPAKLIEPRPSDERGEYVTAAVNLDGDIKQLRAALVEKLETQNGQLRDMLSRFDGR